MDPLVILLKKTALFSELCEMCKYIVWEQSAEFISVTAGGGCRVLSEVKNLMLWVCAS
jgi:hypothetical protein